MRTRPKALGTRFETRTVRLLQDEGLVAERLAEGGLHDRGDIRVLTDREWVGECKDRMSLNLPATLEDAIRKAGHHDVFVVWRKMRRQPGSDRRIQDGPVVVAFTLEKAAELLLADSGRMRGVGE
jgi:hypothetical protein